HYLIGYLNSMPIAEPTKKQQSDIVVLVDEVLKVKNEKEFTELDSAIDNKIYQLYNISEEEIKIAEDFI
ncbi:hypothetical protein KKH38_04465, partial [Patescibacteria group bacterium]|nr:hypothetical protein [Patescibacteria group bacterium]MCG2701481.1 hypothetical protein [Candidatus Parcubacteria bacterium]